MNNKEKVELLREIEEKFQEIIAQISIYENKSCNVFKIMGCENDELRHSTFTGWLLNNDAFFRRFLSLCDIKLSENQIKEPRRIKKEESYRIDELHYKPIAKELYNENDSNRRIDINIIGRTYSITIENKIDTGEHNDQCISYYNYMMDPEGKYKDINKKYFVFLAKNEIEDFEKQGGLIRKQGEDIVEHNVEELIDNLKRKDPDKMFYFNYRLLRYEDIIDFMKNDPQFKNDFIDALKKDNDKISENDILFVEEILNQYIKLVEEWKQQLPKEISVLFDNMSDEQEDCFYKIMENYNALYANEKNSDVEKFLEKANKYYLNRKEILDKNIKVILQELAGEDAKLDTYKKKYAYSLETPKTCKMTKTIDYTATSGISVDMYIALNRSNSDDLISYMKTDDFLEKLNKMPGGALYFHIKKGENENSRLCDIYFDIDTILKNMPKTNKERKAYIDTLFPTEIMGTKYINPSAAKKVKTGKKTSYNKVPVMNTKGENKFIKYIKDNEEYFKKDQIDKTVNKIEEYQKDNPNGCFMTTFSAVIKKRFDGDAENKEEIKEFFIEATKSELEFFGEKIEDMFPNLK